LRFAYGILERQFRRLYEEASRRQGIAGHNLLRLLELRVDNIVFRAGWARTRPQARQFVSHGLLLVNGCRITVPGRRLRPGDELTLSRRAQQMIVLRHNLDTLDRTVPAWLSRSPDGLSITITQEPDRDQIDTPVSESMVIELYSR
jgi:small subunit ribosomal protein S4